MPKLDVRPDGTEVITISKPELKALKNAETVLRGIVRVEPSKTNEDALGALQDVIDAYGDNGNAEISGTKTSKGMADETPDGEEDAE